MKRLKALVVGMLIIALSLADGSLQAQQAPGTRGVEVIPTAAKRQKWALLVGVGDYANSERFGKLAYCGNDVNTLKEYLVKYAGYPENHVYVLHDKQSEVNQMPLRQVIQRTLDAFVTLPGPDDQVIVAFSLHGMEVKGTPYLCPIDADPEKPAVTMLAVPTLYETLNTRCRAAQKVVILDACRRELPGQTRAAAEQEPMSRGLSDGIRQVPKGLLVLSSCTSGQVSYEDPGLCHGVFMHFILQGLAGEADSPKNNGNGDGRVDVNELFMYAAAQTKPYVLEKFRGSQQPEMYVDKLTGPIFLTESNGIAISPSGPIPTAILDSMQNPTEDTERLRTCFALGRVARGKEEAGDSALALTIFRNSLKMADAINDELLKDRALESIAKNQTDAKEFIAAVNTCEKIIDKRVKFETVCYVAKAQAKAGEFSSARDTVNSVHGYIEEPELYSDTMGFIRQAEDKSRIEIKSK
ncbi:MAG: caspase family protein [Thermoguttaceae bacterium]|jgi:uncharacterized caspase-like protein